jgi:diguanylate cyclase (GGDEF)-like protein
MNNKENVLIRSLLDLLLQGLKWLACCCFCLTQAHASSLTLTPEQQQWVKQHPIIKVAFDGYFPPYSFLDDNQKIKGYSVDYFQLLSEKTGLQFVTVPYFEWQQLFAKAKQAKVDVVATMVNKPERQQWFNFTPPYVFKSLVIATASHRNDIQSKAHLQGKTIALVKEYQYVADILKQFPSIVPYYVDTLKEALEVVAAGKADAMIGFFSAIDYYRQKYLLNNIQVTAFYDKNSANESIAIRKDWPMLAQILTTAQQNISQEEQQQLAIRWLPKTSVEKNYDNLVTLALSLGIALIALILWFAHIRKKNQQITRAFARTKQLNKQLTQLKRNLEKQVQLRTEQLFKLTYFDKLTGLNNRYAFLEKLKRALELAHQHGDTGALLTLNINRFKQINDAYGHDVGNIILEKVANRLKKHSKSDDIVARFTGDEFTLWLANIDDEALLPTARKLIQTLEQPIIAKNTPFSLSFCLGIAYFPDDGVTVDTLIKHSETAMFRAKEEKTTIKFFHPQHYIGLSHFLEIEQALLQAIEEIKRTNNSSQFYMVYQPIKWLTKPGVKGFEALIRWLHPTLGVIPPDEFIHIAEQIGVIDTLDYWARSQVLQQMKQWQQQGIDFGSISVNVSASELQQNGFAEQLKQQVVEHQVAFHCLTIEITETAVLKNLEKSLATLKEIIQLGCQLSIDDFGTGYSSLMYVKQIPCHSIKIDREFIKKLPDSKVDVAINKAVIQLGKALELTIIAEGVETAQQLALLQQLGCDCVQGYLIDSPVRAEEITATCAYFNRTAEHYITAEPNA